MQHALLSPSSSNIWLNCPPSARIGANYPDTSTTYADEGTLAHDLCEILLKKAIGLITIEKYKSSLQAIKKSEYYDKNMFEFCRDYRDYCLEQYNKLVAEKKGKVHIKIEVRVDLANYVPGSFGRSDCFMWNDVTVIVIDFKFGKGVVVSPVENSQFRLYAMGVIGWLYQTYKGINIVNVQMHVYQPRVKNIESYTETRAALAEWYKSEVREIAQLAYRGKGEFKAGKHCKFCKAAKNCETLAKFNMQNIDESFNLPNSLTPEFISKVVLNATLFESWLKSVKAYALERAQNGVQFPGLKLVEGKSNRYIDDPENAAVELIMAGVDSGTVYKTKTINTITELEKKLGAHELSELLADYIKKPDGAPTLVSEDDKREPYGTGKTLSYFEDILEIE